MRKLLWLPAGKAIKYDESRDKIGGGGEGQVFQIPAHPDLVAKMFADPQPRQAKIEAMLRNPPSDNATTDHTSIAWPVGALADAATSQFVGYLMKRIEKASPLLEISSPDERMARRRHFTFKHLLVVGWNVAHAFSTLHAKGYVVGDVNESNILVNNRGLATLVDTDSFQVPKGPGLGFYRCPVGRPEFMPPELDGADLKAVDRRTEHDLFGIGVLLFQLLMQGRSPFDGNMAGGRSVSMSTTGGNRYGSAYLFSRRRTAPRKAPPIDLLTPDLEALFVRCFEAGMKNPAARPSASEWMDTLGRAAENLETCSHNAQHVYSSHLKKCVWCQYRGGAGLDFFPIPGTSGTAAPAPQSQKALPPPAITPGSTNAAPASVPASAQATGGSFLGDLLTSFLTGLGNSRSSGSAPLSVPPPPPSAEIQPGGWVMQMQVPVHPMAGPTLVRFRVGLDPAGQLQGTGDMFSMGYVQSCPVAGRWSYDQRRKVLSIQIMINGMPPAFAQSYWLKEGGNGQYLATTPDGVPFSLQRVS